MKKAYLVNIDLTKLPRNAFTERKVATFHIGKKYIPFSEIHQILPCIQCCNSYSTTERVRNFFKLIYISNGRKELQGDTFGIPIWRIVKEW